VNKLLAAIQPMLHGFQSAPQKGERARRIQAMAPAAEGGRVGEMIGIFQRRRGAFPRAMLYKPSQQCLTARDQTVMGVGQGESGKETESSLAELATAAAVLDPIVTVVVRLFAPPAMADDRINQTEGTPANELLHTRRPVEAWLAMAGRKWDKGNRTAWRLSH
jgi:hypothetical protein